MELIFATNNKHKLEEVQHLLGEKVKLLSLRDINFFEDIPEDHDTLEENASQKAFHIHSRFNLNCFADDTGLEIDALNGEPGVLSARYAGLSKSFDDNMNKVLANMQAVENRKARFRTVISLILNDKEYFFEGKVEGEILTEKQGKDGFGYDPIFKPTGYLKSFAQMTLDEKNKISHRAMATNKLVVFLLNYNSKQ